jgi:ABC-type multidrug transport system fused ATPase/permease subunit
VIAFVKGWLLSLVMLACIPPVVIAGGIVSKMLAKISTKGQASYSDAGNIVEQTLGAIKTVSSKALLSDESLHFFGFNLACSLTWFSCAHICKNRLSPSMGRSRLLHCTINSYTSHTKLLLKKGSPMVLAWVLFSAFFSRATVWPYGMAESWFLAKVTLEEMSSTSCLL